ncbi:MAG: 50S ribosomal protein L25 [Chloroflexi bacterium]|nr:50S ribosomal protein L25 [Chloroflexota bacterium]
MAEFTIDAQPRTVTGKKVGVLRREGFVPATVYGPKSEPVNVQIPYRPLELALLKAGGSNLIDITSGGKKHTVLVREVQRNPITRKITHVDFFELDLTQRLRTDVPLQLVGESPAVEGKLGVLITGPTALHVELLPSQLMDHFAVDISVLTEVGQSIHVRDIKLEEGVIILNDPDELIARITQTAAARADEEEVTEGEEEMGSVEPEVVRRHKDEDEDED